MPNINLGDLSLSSDDNGVVLAISDGGRQAQARLSSRDVAVVARFLAEQQFGEQRTGFRVPIQLLLGELGDFMAVTVVHQGKIYDAMPVDISLTGILLRVPGLSVNRRADLVVRIILGDDLVKLPATVVRTDDELVALYFEASMSGGELQPPSELAQIFQRLERAYLRARE